MSALIKELYLDLTLNRLSTDTKADLYIALDQLIQSKLFTARDIYILDYYLSGYTSVEIARILSITTEYTESQLTRIFIALEIISGYTDKDLVQKVQSNTKYARSKISKLKVLLETESTLFNRHGIA